MFPVAKTILLFSVALSVAAMPSHIARNSHAHREVAARIAAPEPIAQPVEVVEHPVVRPQNRRRMKRASNGRCPPASSSSVLPPSSSPEVHSSSSSVHVPESTTTSKPQPQSSSTPKPKPSSTSSSPPKNTGSSSSGNSALNKLLSQTFTGGDGTYYATGLGACGITNKDTDFIAAVSLDFFDTFPGYNGANPNNNGLCGRKVSVEYEGKTITVALTDRCTGCAYDALDFSPAAFNALADPALGRIHGLKWHFI
jgi:hypothetical protein